MAYNIDVIDSIGVTWWIGGVIGVAMKRSQVRLAVVPLSCNNPRKVVHTHVPMSPNSIIWDWT